MAHTKAFSLAGIEAKAPRWNEAEKQAILEQLERILAHPGFRNSKRYPNLLRYVVEQSLKGQTEQLKERTLGIDVFDREPQYDTNADHIVRTTAGEIRKRIAQYYHEPGREFEIRIELPSGSYVPEFHWPVPQVVINKQAGAATNGKRSLWAAAVAVAAAAVALFMVAWTRPRAAETSSDQFWTPVLGSSSSVLFCLGTPPAAHEGKPVDFNAVTLGAAHQDMAYTVGLGDAVTLARLASLVGARRKSFTVRNEFNSTLDDLRGSPAILIGAFNNEWTLRLTRGMRFTFEKDPSKLVYRIRDNQTANADWGLDMNMLAKNQTADYALVSRVYDSTTQRMVVVVAGIGQIGTISAGEFLTDPQYMDALAWQAPKDWEHKNVQVVLTAQVIDGHAGPPRIVTAYFW